jgi:hypothetical protein
MYDGATARFYYLNGPSAMSPKRVITLAFRFSEFTTSKFCIFTRGPCTLDDVRSRTIVQTALFYLSLAFGVKNTWKKHQISSIESMLSSNVLSLVHYNSRPIDNMKTTFSKSHQSNNVYCGY